MQSIGGSFSIVSQAVGLRVRHGFGKPDPHETSDFLFPVHSNLRCKSGKERTPSIPHIMNQGLELTGRIMIHSGSTMYFF